MVGILHAAAVVIHAPTVVGVLHALPPNGGALPLPRWRSATPKQERRAEKRHHVAVARSPSERVRNVRARSEGDKRVRDKLVMEREKGNNTDTKDRKEQKHQKEKKTHRKKKEKYKKKHREADERPAVAAKKKKSGKKDEHMRRDRVTSRPPAVAGNARKEEPRPPREFPKPPRSPETPGVKKVSLSSGSSCPEERSEEGPPPDCIMQFAKAPELRLPGKRSAKAERLMLS